MSAIEIAMDKTASSSAVTSPSRLSDRIADLAIKLSKRIAGNERPADRHPELTGNPWARPIGLGSSH
jgi:hypothetical protein